VLFAAMTAAAYAAAPPSAKPAPQTSANFDQEWSKLVSAAQQEGTVSIASGGAPSRQYRPVADAFTKKFGIKVEVSTGNATDTVNRVLAERKSGKYTVDVALISSRESQQRLVPSESVVPLPPLLIHPEVLDMSSWYGGRHMYTDKFGKFTLIYHAGLEDQYESGTTRIKSKSRRLPRSISRPMFSIPMEGKLAGQGMGDPSGIRQMIDAISSRTAAPSGCENIFSIPA
jgi:hypothetical protein